ncbi:MAG: aminopeptidase N [Betaproteobacteria bacterium RIFCSPLOWO2_12_FULL_64_23]|nr:MAG: aminopeptidase N [Betaproteobacteria bacterium RIFCSPLOWO2_12_FULL_64_23]
MREPAPKTIYLKDYTPSAFLISTIALDIDIREDHALVRATLEVARNPAASDTGAPLLLDGEEIELVSVALDGWTLAQGEYELSRESLCIAKVPQRFRLETVSRIRPKQNTRLEGLYASNDGFFTQCEAEGFRRITWFIDRPDVMARYTTTIHADREQCPVLLSNGNLAAAGEEAGGRHWAKWEDPFPKPCYLFAMVAAKLEKLEDSFVTRSGRSAKLAVYVEPGKLDQCGFAMRCLKSAMKWDEDVYGLELDLDGYMIVAVSDFNSGAMENKGLNIFNTKYVLARPDTATDIDYQNIDRVVAHEYFHNWTGDRVTCRDWFQLSLKEGLTVFRDQEYGADMYSRAVQRIGEVRGLRAAQFPEDAGPMAHPVRPAAYMEIRNFYTMTVYEKGAELVRMQHTLLGPVLFRKGMDLYFERHDGQAVTTDDFVQAMQDASGIDLTQFRRWYEQAGTPVLEAQGKYDAAARRYALTLNQSCPPTPGQEAKLPFHIPFALGLVGPDGEDMPVQLEGEEAVGDRPAGGLRGDQPAGGPQAGEITRVLSLTQPQHRFVFVNVPAPPVPSLLRNFSAPVTVKHDYGETELTHLMAHDANAFNRWEAGQRLALGLILRGVEAQRAQGENTAGKAAAPQAFVAAFARVLADAPRDPAFGAEALILPSEVYIAEQLAEVDPDAIHAVRNRLRRDLAQALRAELLATYHAQAVPGPYSPDARSAGKRALGNLCLGYLLELDDRASRDLAFAQFERADNMTDAMAALAALANCDCAERTQALDAFYAKWKHEPLVVDKWLAVQAGSRLPDTLFEVRTLLAHPAFDMRNPNKVYALIRGFGGNHVRFNAADGGGYRFLAEQVIAIDAFNPQVAARIARAFDRWRKFDAGRRQHAAAALERIRDAQGLSKDVAEIVSKALV